MRIVLALLGLGGVVVFSACGGGDDEVIDASPVADADLSAIDADPNAPDAAVGLPCGTDTCEANEECCAGPGGSECVATGTCANTTFSCDGDEDCDGGEICCPTGGGGTECLANDTCPTPQCETNDDCEAPTPNCCTVGQLDVCSAHCPNN